VKALVDRVTALLEAEQPDVGILDRKELEQPLSPEVVAGGGGRTDRTPMIQRR
jgi:hypothetical protein